MRQVIATEGKQLGIQVDDWRLEQAVQLADSYVPRGAETSCTVAYWYPFEDSITRNHLKMIVSNQLIPMRITVGDWQDVEGADFILGHKGNLVGLERHLSDTDFPGYEEAHGDR